MAKYGQESDLIQALERLDSEADEVKKGFDDRVEQNLGEVRGTSQWKIKERKPYFQYNVIRENIDAKVGKVSEMKPRVKILPMRNGLGDAAEVLMKCSDYLWHETSMNSKLERVGHYGADMGVAFASTAWRPELRFGEGEVDVIIHDPRGVKVDPSVKDPAELKRAEYVIIEDIVPLGVIHDQIPGRGAMVVPDSRYSTYQKPDKSTAGRVKSAAAKLGAKSGQFPQGMAIPRCIIDTYWIQDRRKSVGDPGDFPIIENLTETASGNGRPFPGGRKIIVGRGANGKIVLRDTYNEFWDGEWPIDMLSWNIDLETIWGPDDVQRQIKLQEAINRTGDAFVGNILKNAIIRLMVDRGAMDPKQTKAYAEDAAEIIFKNPGREVVQTVPAILPDYVMNLVGNLVELSKRNIGVLDAQLQKQMPSIVTGPAIEGLQLAVEGSIRTAARRMEEFTERIGQKMVSRAFQFFTSDRILHYVGDAGLWKSFEYQRSKLLLVPDDKKPGQFRPRSIEELQKAYRDFRYVVEPGSSLAITKLQRASLKFESFKAGGYRLSKVMEEFGIENAKEEMEKAKEEREEFGIDPMQTDGRKKQRTLGEGAI